MPINDLPALSILRTKMQWHQERQRVLAENVSNSNTPNFKPRDLVEPKFEAGSGKIDGASATLPMARTASPFHRGRRRSDLRPEPPRRIPDAPGRQRGQPRRRNAQDL